jgi:hypothetical protein
MRCRWRSRPPTARSWTAASRWAQVRSRRQLEARRPAVHRRPPTTRLRSLDAATLTCKPCRDYRTSTPGAKTEVANQLGALMDTPGPAPRPSSPSTPPPRPAPARSPNNPARPAWSTSAGQPYTPSRDALATFADNSRHASPRAATLYRQPASRGGRPPEPCPKSNVSQALLSSEKIAGLGSVERRRSSVMAGTIADDWCWC